MNLKELDIDGLNLVGIFGYQIYREKYDHIYMIFEGGMAILIKTNEVVIEGGEVYEVVFNKDENVNVFDLKEVLGIVTNIESSHVVRRDEWYSPILTTESFVGENPRSLNWAKPKQSKSRKNCVKTVDCGLLLRGPEVHVLFYTSDYPGCIEISLDKEFIENYMQTAELI